MARLFAAPTHRTGGRQCSPATSRGTICCKVNENGLYVHSRYKRPTILRSRCHPYRRHMRTFRIITLDPSAIPLYLTHAPRREQFRDKPELSCKAETFFSFFLFQFSYFIYFFFASLCLKRLRSNNVRERSFIHEPGQGSSGASAHSFARRTPDVRACVCAQRYVLGARGTNAAVNDPSCAKSRGNQVRCTQIRSAASCEITRVRCNCTAFDRRC